jgi:hypothetical protein
MQFRRSPSAKSLSHVFEGIASLALERFFMSDVAKTTGYQPESKERAWCLDCRYFFQDYEDQENDMGECRRNPPTGQVFEDSRCFPRIHGVFWCGEWQLRKLCEKTDFDGGIHEKAH